MGNPSTHAGGKSGVATVAAELVQLVPVPSPARVASSFTVTEVGTTPVRVFTVRSLLTPRLTVWSGVTRQEQHEISSSPGSNAYTFTQMLPDACRSRDPATQRHWRLCW